MGQRFSPCNGACPTTFWFLIWVTGDKSERMADKIFEYLTSSFWDADYSWYADGFRCRLLDFTKIYTLLFCSVFYIMPNIKKMRLSLDKRQYGTTATFSALRWSYKTNEPLLFRYGR